VEVTAGSTKTGIDAKLKTGGEISGQVTAASGGSPLPGLEVCASSFGGEGQSENCASTNGGGEYLIVGLGTGEYRVSFAAGESGPYLSTSTSGVKVTAPNPTTGVDAALQTGGQISGRVTAATGGAPIAHVGVCADDGESFGCASTNANGEYAVVGLATGSYSVSFSPSEEAGNYLSSTAGGVSVTAPNATGPVNAALQTGGQISGNVTAANGGQPLTNVFVSAGNEKGFGFAATGAGGATSTTSNALAIPAPNSTFSVKKKAVFNPKNDDLEFFFTVTNAGKFSWSLFFKNSDVAFASSLNLGDFATESAVAETAKKKHKSKKCKKGQIKHKGKCVRELVSFGSGSQSVAAAGNVTVKVHASSQAIKGLKAGHTLHVSGVFTFQSSLGGAPVKHTESAVVKLAKKKHKGKKHHKH